MRHLFITIVKRLLKTCDGVISKRLSIVNKKKKMTTLFSMLSIKSLFFVDLQFFPTFATKTIS